MKRYVLPLLSVLALAQSARATESGFWNETTLCEAGVYTYFFLKQRPELLEQKDGFLRLKSKAGHVYECRLSDEGRIFLRWINADKIVLTSQKVRHRIDGDDLVVTTDMATKHFAPAGKHWREAFPSN